MLSTYGRWWKKKREMFLITRSISAEKWGCEMGKKKKGKSMGRFGRKRKALSGFVGGFFSPRACLLPFFHRALGHTRG